LRSLLVFAMVLRHFYYSSNAVILTEILAWKQKHEGGRRWQISKFRLPDLAATKWLDGRIGRCTDARHLLIGTRNLCSAQITFHSTHILFSTLRPSSVAAAYHSTPSSLLLGNMPQENKKRGRRAETQKRKLEELDEQADQKRRKTDNGNVQPEEEIERGHGQHPDTCLFASRQELTSTPFYGLLDEEEQEYFRRADDMLEVNQFDPEERTLFLANVYKEAEGKELKLAHSQSCSRLMERLILLSTPEQLKTLLRKFSGQ